MIDLITSQLVEAMTRCRRKAFFIVHETLKLDRHEYEAIIERRAAENRIRFPDSIGIDRGQLRWSSSAQTRSFRRHRW